MAKKTLQAPSSENCWRMITQSGLKGVSPQSKKRRFFSRLKTLISFFGIGIFITALFFAVYFYKTHSPSTAFIPIIKHVEIESDGVLMDSHLIRFINLPKDVHIMNVDIFHLKQRLESLAQVRSAVVERQFPDRLKIIIHEYHPILKVVAVDESGKHQGLLVSKEGHVFRGYGYSADNLKYLPYLTGINLRKSGKSFKTILHMDYLYELIRCAQLESPQLYKSWKSISLEYCQNGNRTIGAFIKVKTRTMGEIIFAPKKFELQLNRLNSIVSYASKQKLATIERIDLSMGNQAAVKVASTP